jgi:ribose 5-phosphate isomerase B
MKRFDLITETDARMLERHSTVRLSLRGHITPLARDTLRERQVKVVRDDLDIRPEELTANPNVRTVAVGGDASAGQLVSGILTHLRGLGLSAYDAGLEGGSSDYVEAAAVVAERVSNGEADVGIVIGSTGFGSAVAANKVRRVRAAMCSSVAHARSARNNVGANVLALEAGALTLATAIAIINAFIDAGMHNQDRIDALESLDRLDRHRS